jgi:hypothetical protein
MEQRLRLLNDAPISRRGRYVLYWCRWSRRVEANHALAFAAGVANRMKLPLVVYQRITAAGDRSHTFELQGVPEFAGRPSDVWARASSSNWRAANTRLPTNACAPRQRSASS